MEGRRGQGEMGRDGTGGQPATPPCLSHAHPSPALLYPSCHPPTILPFPTTNSQPSSPTSQPALPHACYCLTPALCCALPCLAWVVGAVGGPGVENLLPALLTPTPLPPCPLPFYPTFAPSHFLWGAVTEEPSSPFTAGICARASPLSLSLYIYI